MHLLPSPKNEETTKLFKARFLGADRLGVLKGGEHSESQKISVLSGTEWNLASAWLSRICLV
jgi:hypothetical protein